VKIHLLRSRVTAEQLAEMLEELQTYVKLAVDVERGIVAGGGEWHADCEQVLLMDGSRQDDIWGADWLPDGKQVQFEALINIRPRQQNRSIRL
jgi:hypothetical protein